MPSGGKYLFAKIGRYVYKAKSFEPKKVRTNLLPVTSPKCLKEVFPSGGFDRFKYILRILAYAFQ